MRRLPYPKGKSLALIVLGALVVILVTALGGLNGSDTELSVQAFYSPIRPPTPFPTPTPRPYPTPEIACPPSTTRTALAVEVIVEGLSRKGSAELQLLPDNPVTAACLSENDTVLPRPTIGNGRTEITVADMPDGYYKLVMHAPKGYFRDPAGYLFQVFQGEIVRTPDRAFRFDLIFPADQDLPPCEATEIRSTNDVANSSENDIRNEPRVVCRAERMVDLSTSSKPSASVGRERHGSPASNVYRYAGPQSDQDNQGVWGRRYVVDPTVDHSLWPWQKQFVVEYSYPMGPAPNRYWMEAGWSEVSWRNDQQYIYQFDSATNEWHFFDQFAIGVGSPVETMVEYKPDTDTWQALLYLYGSSWAQLAEENLGFSLADVGHNWGEIYLSDSNMPPPILPPSKFDKGYLKINEVWKIWDTSYGTFVREDPPYRCDIIEKYTHFNIHSPIVFLPLVMKSQ